MLVHVEIGDPHLEGQQWGRQQAQEGDAPEREHAATLTPEPPRGRKPPVPRRYAACSRRQHRESERGPNRRRITTSM